METNLRITEDRPAMEPISAALVLRTVWAVVRTLLLLVGHQTVHAVRRARAVLLRAYVYYCVQASSAAKCPSCGIRAAHEMRWNQLVGALVHVCKRCMAVWTEKPMVQAEAWSTRLVAEEEEVSSDGVRSTTTQSAQREPIVTNQFKPTGRSNPVIVRLSSGGNA